MGRSSICRVALGIVESLESRRLLSGAIPELPEDYRAYIQPNRHLFPDRELWFVQFEAGVATDADGYHAIVQRIVEQTGIDLRVEDVSNADVNRVAITSPVGLDEAAVREALDAIEHTRWFTPGRRDGTHEHFETMRPELRLVEFDNGRIDWVVAGSFVVGFSENHNRSKLWDEVRISPELQAWLDEHPQVQFGRFLGTNTAATVRLDPALTLDEVRSILSDMPGFERVELNGLFYTTDVRPGIVWSPRGPRRCQIGRAHV